MSGLSGGLPPPPEEPEELSSTVAKATWSVFFSAATSSAQCLLSRRHAPGYAAQASASSEGGKHILTHIYIYIYI